MLFISPFVSIFPKAFAILLSFKVLVIYFIHLLSGATPLAILISAIFISPTPIF